LTPGPEIGVEPVADYYLYLLDPKGSITKRVELIGCPGDDHARDLAAAHPHAGRMELWERSRLVERFGAVDETRPAAPPRPGPEPRALYKLDKDLRFVTANDVALTYWGKTLPEVSGRTLTEAFPSAAGSKPYEAHLQTLRSGRPFHSVVRSPILAEPIDLEIHPHADGLQVSFLKVRQAPANSHAA
jgi:hypothetical protein